MNNILYRFPYMKKTSPNHTLTYRGHIDRIYVALMYIYIQTQYNFYMVGFYGPCHNVFQIYETMYINFI